MRMFLVGMCDIFLILYLTSLSQVSPYRNSNLTVDDYNKIKESEAQAISDAEGSKEKILELEKIISALKEEKDQSLQLAQSAHADAKAALKRIESYENKVNKAKEAEAKALEVVNSEREKVLQTENALAEALNDREEIRKLLQNTQESERLAIQRSKDAQQKMQVAMQNEQNAFLVANEAQQKAERASENKIKALELAKKAQQEAEKARENEARALESAKEAQNQKEIALQNERKARKAEAKALGIANAAQNEAAETRLKIQTITQASDDAFNENISDKLTQFTVTIKYKNRIRLNNKKVITMQGLPVKIDNYYLIFVLLDQIGLGSSLTPNQYITYNITVNNLPVTKLYVKDGKTKIAALVLNSDVKYSQPLGKINNFSSYMPILLSIRSQDVLGVMDRIRGINTNFFIFKRDYLRMISMDELYYNNVGIRGTGDYAEYIVKGDQIVDLGGNFIGLAYKKNTIIRIDRLDGWHEISMNKISARRLAKQIKDVINS